MMSKDQKEANADEANISSLRDGLNRLLASSVGSIAAESMTLPADVIKTRLQVQNFASVTASAQQTYNGMFDAFVKISKHEGATGLFKGLQPALIRQVSYTGLAFVVFEPVRDAINNVSNTALNRPKDQKPGFMIRVLSGGIAGAIGISVMNPTEVLKTKMQTNQSLAYHEAPSMTNIIRNVFKQDGIFGFWAGVYPNIWRAFLVNAAEIGMYDNAKNMIINEYKLCNDGMIGHISASFIAGVSSAIISTPVDVVKTRFMNQAGTQTKQYNQGMIKSLILIPKQEGFQALYKGFYPIICRKVIWCTVFFVTYERVRCVLGLPRN